MIKSLLKIAVLFCLVGYLSANVPIPKQLEEMTAGFRQQCVTDTGLNPDILTKMDNGGDVSDDGAFKCYIKCIMNLIGAVSDKGIDLEKLVAVVPADVQQLAKDLLDKCKDIEAITDTCESSYQFVKCFHDNFPEKFFIV
nr:odorant-binding protein 2 [Psyttalia incisi]